jgi:hypothetical protein
MIGDDGWSTLFFILEHPPPTFIGKGDEPSIDLVPLLAPP